MFWILLLLFAPLLGTDFNAYRQKAWAILDEGSRTGEAEVQLLTLLGAKMSQDETAISFYLKALKNPKPEIQLAAIKLLAELKHDRADEAILEGLKSNEIIIRLETLLLMAQRGMPGVADQIDGLMAKIPKELHSVFPPLFAMAKDKVSVKRLRLMLSDPDDKVRASSALSVEKGGIEELLPHIRRLAKQVSPLVQEAAIHCLGVFGDAVSLPLLRRLSSSTYAEVKIAALQALSVINEEEALPILIKEGKTGNLFAISLLGDIAGGSDELKSFLASKEPLIQINAALALLNKGDRDGLRSIGSLLLAKKGIVPHATPLKAAYSWKLIGNGPYEDPLTKEKVKIANQEIIRRIFLLSEDDALLFAKEVLDREEKELIPPLVSHLVALGSPKVITLLDKYQQKVGAPYVRGVSALALFKLGQKERRTEIISFLKAHHNIELIQVAPLLDEKKDPFASTPFELTPEETSTLYVEMLEALLTEGKEDGIEVLMEAIEKGHPNNRYALAGLLIRATL